MAIPRSEYPRPQFVRPDWMNLNGLYTYDRQPKFETERLRGIMARKAAIED